MGDREQVIYNVEKAQSSELCFVDSLIAENFSDFRAIALHELNADDDAASDCMMLLLEVARTKAAKIKKHPNPTGFLFKSLKYCILKQRERMGTNKPVTVDISPFENILYSAGEIDDPDIDEILDAKAQILSNLTENEYSLYKLFYADEKKISEIADMLNISENAAKVRLHRLRAKLHILAKDYYDM